MDTWFCNWIDGGDDDCSGVELVIDVGVALSAIVLDVVAVANIWAIDGCELTILVTWAWRHMATVLVAVSTHVCSDCHGLASKSSIEVVNNSLSFADSWSADSYSFLTCAYVSCSSLDSEFCDCEKVRSLRSNHSSLLFLIHHAEMEADQLSPSFVTPFGFQ